jgi:hypothetical protein
MSCARRFAAGLAFISAIGVISVHSEAQNWSYQGSSICYTSGAGSSQCYGAGTIQRYVTSREQFDAQFRAGWVAGQGIGSLVSALVNKWAENRRIVEAERNDLRSQLRSYEAANRELLDQLIVQQNTLIDRWPRLAKHVPPVANDADSTVKQFEQWATQFATQKTQSQKNIAIIAGAKNRNFIRQNVEVLRQQHETLYAMASKGHVFKEFVSAVVGYHEFEEQRKESRGIARDGPGFSAFQTVSSAAEQGDPESQARLGEMFLEGRGVPQDYVTAHMWFNLASASGMTKARELRDFLAARMTPAQIAEAQQLAREWKPKGNITQAH